MSKEQIPGMPGYEADLVMPCVTYDTIMTQSDITEYRLFDEYDDNTEPSFRQNNLQESLLIKWILSNSHDRNMGLTRKELGISSDFEFFMEVAKPIITDREIPGDIDLLAINKKRPDQTVAFQIKRIKARVLENQKIEIYTKYIHKGVIQAREMAHKYCFHRNYLMLVLVADTLYHKNNFQALKNLPYEEKLCIYKHPSLSDLPEEVGLYMYELSQPSRNVINHTGTIAVKEFRQAKRFDQPSQTTEAIIEYLKMTN
jgi:hypothetical protein